jgi:hypothetical protein
MVRQLASIVTQGAAFWQEIGAWFDTLLGAG